VNWFDCVFIVDFFLHLFVLIRNSIYFLFIRIFSRPYLVRSCLCDELASVCLLSVTLCIVAKWCILE